MFVFSYYLQRAETKVDLGQTSDQFSEENLMLSEGSDSPVSPFTYLEDSEINFGPTAGDDDGDTTLPWNPPNDLNPQQV